MTRARRSLLAATIIVAGLSLAACAPQTEASPEPTSEESLPPTPTSNPEPSETPPVEADPTCETIIPETTVNNLLGLGWAPLQEPFQLSSVILEGGLLCKWGDPAVPSDHVQIYGWAPITATQASSAQLEFTSGGWRREDGAEGVYITESEETATGTDDQGYGWTYLFGDGWVKFADTKQGLLLIEWPVG